VAVSGTTAVVSGDGQDKVYLYVKTASGWPSKPKVVLTYPDLEIPALFGVSVAISGSTLIVGAPPFGTGAGAAYIYVKGKTGWPTTPTAQLADPSLGDGFGISVAVSGTNGIVGADQTASNIGAAYIYSKGASGWPTTPSATVIDPPESPNSHFGAAVGVSGTTAVVGAYGAGPSVSGTAYIFQSGTSGWSLTATLAGPAGPYASFGTAVAISGTTALIGANFAAGDAGAA
jgi:hypothetical protein